ncbi:MAG: lamin tail domain-containing protein, partial [bacterium]
MDQTGKTAGMKRVLTTVAMATLWLASGLGAGVALGQGGPFINEFMADNSTTLTNSLGKSDDWIELCNPLSTNVSLKGWYLTDDAGNLTKWKFPTNSISSIAGNGFLLVWADSKSYSVTNSELHANFSLDKNGEYLALVKTDGVTVVSEFQPLPQYQDMSYGIGASGEQRYFAVPTPGRTNAFAGASNEVADTKFNPDSGFYSNAVAVTTTCATAGAEIRYTTDCSVPTTNSLLYTSPIPVTNTTVLRAVAFKSGYAPSGIDTHTYIFPAQAIRQPTKPSGFPTNWVGLDGVNYAADYAMDPVIVTNPAYAPFMTNALLALPSLSVVTVLSNLFDQTYGIYVNPTNDGWERPATAEWLTTNNTTLFKADCGLRIQGGYVRPIALARKKALRMVFQSEFGPSKLKCDLFDKPTAAKSFDNLVLRSGSQDAWLGGGVEALWIQNTFVPRTQLAMGWPSEHGTYAHLYLNGLYWGLYNPIERGDESFAETYYGGDKTNWNVRTRAGWQSGPEPTAWTAMTALCNAGLADNAAYQKIQGNNPDRTRNPAYPVYLDILCHIDYLILEHWIGIGDWHQIVMCNRDAASSGFRFPIWDSDASLKDVTVNRTRDDFAGYYALLENAEYRLLFADRIYRHMFNGGELTTTQTLPRFRELAAMLDPALLGESARWGDQAYDGSRYTIDNWRAAANSAYTVFLPHRTSYVIPQYRQIGLYPSIDPPRFNQQGGAFANGFPLIMTSTNAVYYTLDGTDPREYGTGNPTGLFYTDAVPLSYSVKVKARARSGAGEWSALNEALFVKSSPAPQLRITEVMYHPRKPTGTETNGGWNEDDFQFIELLNTGEEPVGLAGMRLTDGGSFDFSDGAVSRLLPGEYAVVVKNKTAFTNRYAALMPIKIAGEFKRVFDFPQSELSHNGETVTLKDATNGVMATFTYGDGRDWPAATDGAGHSLVPLPTMIADQANGALDYGGNWRASAYRDGSPGRADPSPVTDVVLNEIMAHTDYSGGALWQDSNDWIEFYNTKTSAVSFTTNWYLSDDPEDLKQWMIPGTNSVAATNWITFFEVGGFHPATNSGFGLNKAGEAVYLSYLAGGTNDRVVDCVRFKAQANFRTWGRYPDGASRWYTTLPTTNKANALAANTVVINEIMYHPATNANYPVDNGDIEYVELYNPGGEAIALTNEGGACRLSSGVDYVFPTNTTIPAGGYLTLVSFDPSTNSAARVAFLASYGLTNGQVRLMGPYSGRLSDGGDRVAVEFPLLGDLPGEGISWVIMDEVYYSDRLPWPETADGSGPSLNRLQTGRSGNDPANWMGASPSPGTSNTVSAATPVPVVSVTSLSVPEGGTNTFKVWLSAAPTGNATVTVSRVSGETNLAVQSGASLVFSSGNATQTVTLAATPDANAADGVATFVCAIANGASVAVAVTEADRDVWVTLSGAGLLGTVSPAVPVAVTNGGSVVISAQANPGYVFTTWSVVSGSATITDTNGATTSVKVFGPATLAANFTVDVFTCSMTMPTNRMAVLGTDLTIQATTFSSPRACTVASMEFYANGVKFGAVTSAPYSCQWTPATTGMYALAARATDNLGRTCVSATETVAVVYQDGVTAIGGTATNYTLNGTNFTAHVFTNSGLLVASSGVGVQVLLVAGGGGGGGGYEGGGGGAGGVRLWSGAMGGAYTITVGAGGDGAVVGGNVGANGMPSSIVGPGVSIGATGGGRGSASLSGYPASKYNYAGAAGGSGGGGEGAAAGIAVGGGELGNSGGIGTGYACGGGGGAGGPGGAAPLATTPGTGGVGIAVSYLGTPVTYAAGGNGGWRNPETPINGASGGANTGNGGSGGGGNVTGNGGNGGSGIVIVRYVTVAATNIYTVAYDANGANSGNAPATQSKTQNVAMAVSGNSGNLAKTGHTFAGWNTATNGTGANYATGANYPWNASVTLYAKWMTNTPPTITAQPIGATVVAGLTATFGVTASGIAPLFYQWYTNNAAISGATGTTYITPATTTNDSGKMFKVTVSNSYGAVTSSVATLTVNAAPTGTVAGTGGFITRYRENETNFIAHIFTNSSAFTLNSSMNVQYLVVAGGGGGGGGYQGGGGGAGGLHVGSTRLPAGTYTITVGTGGNGCRWDGSGEGSNGLPSSISIGGVTLASATGGGRGASATPTYGSAAGGSGGGGACGGVDLYGSDGTLGEGNVGGNGDSYSTVVQGGGGGAGDGGQTGSEGGTGGVGIAVSYSGVQVAYATGGNGSKRYDSVTNGAGPAANTGNGGHAGGGSTGTGRGGNGGSGIVILRYDANGGSVLLAVPTALTATAVNTHQIQLTWTDNATNETGYVVDRSPDGSTWNALTSLAANATAYTDDGLA